MERVAVALWQVQQADGAGLTLDQRADRGLLVLADDEVSFPVPSLATVLGWEWTLMDRLHRLLKPGSTPIGSLLGAAVFASRAQRGATLGCERRRAHQRRSGLVDRLVDAFRAQPHRPIVRELVTQVPADLLRAPPLRQQLTDHAAQLDV